jgi:hypothetical protein
MSKTAVAETKATSVAPADLMDMFEENAGAGLEHIGSDEMQIPFVRILQALSPQLNKQDALYIKGAEQGDIFNTVSNRIYKADEGLVVIPVAFETKYLEFQLRASGGGFVGERNPNDPDLAQTRREGPAEILPSGNELVRTHQHLVLVYDEDTGEYEPAVMDMKKTQLKVSRKWNSQRKSVRAMGKNGMFLLPIYGTAWRVTTIAESNDQGSWYNFRIERVEDVAQMGHAMLEAKTMAESFQKGEIKTAAASKEEMRQAEVNVDDMPF